MSREYNRAMRIALFLALVAAFAGGTAQDGPVVYFSHSKDFFTTTGKWASDSANPGDKPALPHEVQIDCFRGQRQCIESTADLYMGHPHISVEYFDILSWDQNGIVTTASSGICATTKLLINFADKSITSINSPKKLDEKTRGACEFFGMKGSLTWVFVAKGTARWKREH